MKSGEKTWTLGGKYEERGFDHKERERKHQDRQLEHEEQKPNHEKRKQANRSLSRNSLPYHSDEGNAGQQT